MNSHLFSWTFVTFAFFAIGSGHSYNQSRELLQTVLKNYDRRLRLNLNQSQPTVVKVMLYLLNINSFDEINSKFSVTGFLSMEWRDEIINWNSDTNYGITYLNFPVNEAWHPTFVLTYNHGKLGNPAEDWMSVKIMSDGNAQLFQGDIYNAVCRADVTNFPFDVQTCLLAFSSWTTDEQEIQIEPTEYVIGDYLQKNGEWEIIDNSSSAGYPVNDIVTFKITLRRKPMYYVVNIILPVVIMSLLSILVFALPPQSGERISYSITVLLASVVFLTIIGEHLPKTSDPMAALPYFLSVNLITSALICVFTVLNLQIYFKDNTTYMPVWAQFVIRLTTCANPRTARQDSAQTDNNTANSTQDSNLDTSEHINVEAQKYDSSGTTWTKVSQSMDRICMLFFLFVTIINSVSYVIFVWQN